jgi:hypothetical protein
MISQGAALTSNSMVGDIDAARAKGEKILADLGTSPHHPLYFVQILTRNRERIDE